MKLSSMIVVALLLAVTSVVSISGQTLIIRLDQDKKTQQLLPEGTFTIEVRNQLPGAEYIRSVDIREREVAPIDLAAALPKAAEVDDVETMIASIRKATRCSAPAGADQKLTAALTAATTEKEVATALETTKEYCLPETAALVASTRYTFDQPATVKRGQELIVTITRGTETWVATYATASRGSFRTSYGFSFLPNRDQEYFSYELGSADNVVDDKKYEIRRKRSNSRSGDSAPTVNFSWYPAWRPKPSWSLGPTVALGFDFSNPLVLAGFSATYNQNLTISFGAAAQKQKRLVGQYSPGQRVKENLDSSALTTETYAPNFFVSVSVRSLANPFSR